MKPDLRPMLATLTDKPFDDPDWVFETKWDGFRAIAMAGPGHASLHSRNSNDVSRRFPTICAALSKIKHEAVLDGELVALDEHGRSHFQLLQNVGTIRRACSTAFSTCSISTVKTSAARPYSRQGGA